MKKALLATKVGMTQVFNEAGQLIPVTVLQAGPCTVVQVKTAENDGYDAVKVAFGEVRTKLVGKPVQGTLEKAGVQKKEVEKANGAKREVYPTGRFMKEFRFENAGEYKLLDEIKADVFAAGDKIDATAISKGKGYAGTIKRYNQHRGPMAHGSKYHRHQGSNGSSSDPSRVRKGKRMPGHMGAVKVTVQNLEVVRADAEKGILLVKGSVPGAKKALITIKETTKNK